MPRKLTHKELETLVNKPTNKKPTISNESMTKMYRMYSAIYGDYADEIEIEQILKNRTRKHK